MRDLRTFLESYRIGVYCGALRWFNPQKKKHFQELSSTEVTELVAYLFGEDRDVMDEVYIPEGHWEEYEQRYTYEELPEI